MIGNAAPGKSDLDVMRPDVSAVLREADWTEKPNAVRFGEHRDWPRMFFHPCDPARRHILRALTGSGLPVDLGPGFELLSVLDEARLQIGELHRRISSRMILPAAMMPKSTAI